MFTQSYIYTTPDVVLCHYSDKKDIYRFAQAYIHILVSIYVNEYTWE